MGNDEARKILAPEEVRPEYYQVPVSLYRTDDEIETDLYIYYQRQHILYKSKGSRWLLEDYRKLTEFGLQEISIKFDSPKFHQEFLSARLSKILIRPSIPLKEKAQLLVEVAPPILSTIYTSQSSAETIAGACGYVKNCIQYLNERNSLPELVTLSGKTLNEHTHALHVSAYAMALAKVAGFQNYEEVFAIGMGGLLHDIGKSKIETAVLNKPGELDEQEWQLMRQHPKFGEEILDRRQVVPLLSKRIVLEHHERVNGKGYPRGIKNVHIFSKVVSIADCFNSMTTPRVYRKQLKPFDALKYMVVNMKEEFDETLLKTFIEMLSK